MNINIISIYFFDLVVFLDCLYILTVFCLKLFPSNFKIIIYVFYFKHFVSLISFSILNILPTDPNWKWLTIAYLFLFKRVYLWMIFFYNEPFILLQISLSTFDLVKGHMLYAVCSKMLDFKIKKTLLTCSNIKIQNRFAKTHNDTIKTHYTQT